MCLPPCRRMITLYTVGCNEECLWYDKLTIMKITIPPYSVSPLIQKTFIALGLATFVVETAGALYSFIMGTASGPFDPSMLRMLPGMLLPALLFVLAFFVSSKSASRRWRFFIATMFTSAILVIQQVALVVFYALLTPTMESADVPVPWYLRHADLLSLAPVVIAVVGLLWFLKKRSFAHEPATPRLQVMYIATLAVSFVVLLGTVIWENLKPSPYGAMDSSSVLVSVLMPTVVPIVLFLIAFLTAKKGTPLWNKVFVSMIYVTIAVFVSVSFGAGLMLVNQLNPEVLSMDVANYGSMIAAAVTFIAIVVWHKKCRAY